jgi:hypothetical protein
MARSIRIPLLVDIIIVKTLDEIRALAANPAVDRDYWPTGPLVNRIIKARFTRATRTKDGMLPAFLGRDFKNRKVSRKELTERLDAIDDASIKSDPDLAKLAAYVRGETTREPGQEAQALVCRLFNPEFQANRSTWRAAKTLHKYLQRPPYRGFLVRFSGRLGRAVATLDQAVNQDIEGVHAIGIAVHSLVSSIKSMRELYANRVDRERTNERNVAIRCVQAPDRVVRTVNRRVQLPMRRKPVTNATLLLINLNEAVLVEAGTEAAFQSLSWAACPAHGFVPRLLGVVWLAAKEGGQHE